MEWPVKAVNATMRIVAQAADYIAANGLLIGDKNDIARLHPWYDVFPCA